jgi:hypothetical protein
MAIRLKRTVSVLILPVLTSTSIFTGGAPAGSAPTFTSQWDPAMTDPPLELIEHWVADAIEMVCEGVIAPEAIHHHVACLAAEWGYNQRDR